MKFSKKNILTTGLAVTLAAAMLIGGGTFAYLQDNTEAAVNSFNTNTVTVELGETTGDQYNIIPGMSQEKNPKVTVNATVPAYVYVEVTDETDGLVTYEIADGWTLLEGYTDVYYREVVADDAQAEFDVLKDNTVSYSAALENSDMLDENGNLKDGIKLTFRAYAIQKEPFNDAVLAYNMEDAVEVSSAQALADALEAGQSVILSDDIAVDDFIEIPEDGMAVLDLNGKTITTSANSDTDLGQNRPIVNYGTLTVIGNGTIDTTPTQGFGAIRNFGTLILEDGNYIGYDLSNGSAIDTQEGATTIINGGRYYATAAIMNREGGTVEINGGDFEGVSNENSMYGDGVYSYAIRNYGTMTINDGNIHGSMNGGIACDKGTITINGGRVTVEATPSGAAQTFYVLVTNTSANAQIIVNGGIFEQKNGTNRLLGGFAGMPSWDATENLAGNGYIVNGGTFILNGTEVTVGD